ncbi:DUF6493 family protein [Peterkaempfera bronchialis]|uniref:DUF7824 domain-containing protein n=1 Tax=Peterkaempfera bronchialis TaxID=2126346 RepID=UPI003C2F3CE3
MNSPTVTEPQPATDGRTERPESRERPGRAANRLLSRVAGALAQVVARGAADGVVPAETPQDRLFRAVRLGAPAEVPALLRELDPAARRACLPRLRELRRELREEWGRRTDYREAALLVAGTGCNTGAAAAAQWISAGAREALADFAFRPLIEVFTAQEPEWQAAVAQRLADRRDTLWGWSEYPFVEYLLRITGSPVPTSDAFVTRWVENRTWGHAQRRPGPGAEALPKGRTLLDRLRADSYLPVLAPRLFDLPDIGGALGQSWQGTAVEDTWFGALARLAADGVLDRADLIDRCLSRLLRGGSPGDLRGFLAILEALDLTPDEQAAHAQTYVRLLPDAHSTVAAHAQQVLTALDTDGRLDPEYLAETSRAVLFRSEKKLVRSQLSWLDRVARREPGRAADAVLAAADALGHEDTTIQERALNLIARHLGRAGDGVLSELRAAAEGLDPVHHTRAAVLLGAAPTAAADEPADLLPPAPEPQPLPPPPATPAEVAEEVAAMLATHSGVAAFERALDGLVRHAHRDRQALAAALEPVLPKERWLTWDSGNGWGDCGPADIAYVALAVLGRHSGTDLQAAHQGRRLPFRGHQTIFGKVLGARLIEAAWQITGENAPPFLLATPTLSTGALDPAELVRRLQVYEQAGATPGEVDFSQALLRLTPDATPGTVAAADALTSPHGRQLAQWLHAGGPTVPSVVRARAQGDPSSRPPQPDDRRILLYLPAIGAPVPLAEPLAVLLRTAGPRGSASLATWGWSGAVDHWPAVLPHLREVVAARCLRRFVAGADQDERGAAGLLPLLAEAGGPAGEAVHLAVGYGLGARFAEDRAAAVDALLVLAARGDLDGDLLGRRLAELVALGAVKPNRLSDALRTASRTGAYGTVWSVLAAALPGLLTGPPVRGTGDLLSIAGDCARRSGARGALPEVSALAARPGSARLVKEARQLRDALSPET